MTRAVVVGGGGTGDAAAFALRKRGFEGEIAIISADEDRPYDRPYLSKEFLRGEVDLPKVFLHDDADYSKERIELRLGQRVTGGSLSERKLKLSGGDEVAFDVLVLGLGGTPRRLPDIPEAGNVLTLRSLRDSQSIRDALGRASRVPLARRSERSTRESIATVGSIYAPARKSSAGTPMAIVSLASRFRTDPAMRWTWR